MLWISIIGLIGIMTNTEVRGASIQASRCGKFFDKSKDSFT